APKGRRRPARPRPFARASYNSDSVGHEAELEDHLNMRNEVNALCAVIAANDVEPPLSVGLFGDWGSGKSYFMQLMDRRISKLAQQSRAAIEKDQPTAFYPHIRQIWFNAWHYIDANLWASLVTHIFEELVKPEDESTRAASKAQSDQKALARELETSKALINEATTAQENARATIEKRESELAEAKRTRILIGSYLREHRIARTAFGAAITLLLVATGLFVIQPEWVTRGVEWLVAASSDAIGAYGAFKNRILTRLREAGQDFDVVREFVGSHREQRSEKLQQEIELLKGQEARLQREIDDASRRMHVAEGEIEDIKRGRRLHKYIQERAHSSDYQEYLGLIALVRRDFEHLSKLLDEGRKARVEERKATGKKEENAEPSKPGEPPLPAIDRVVLYIDDLDRCPADRVVQVLEAVHLLLAFELFVVVVGVDSRWLFRSLERHYSDQLRQPDDGVPTSGQDDSYWASTPQNYLEKIFQIPFSIRRMPRGGYERLIDSLLKAEIDRSGLQVVTGESPAGNGEAGRPAPVPGPGPLVPPAGAPLDAPSPSSAGAGASASPTPSADNTTSAGDEEPIDLDPGALKVTEVEVAFMKELSELVATPRAAKRMVNTYRLIRAMLDDDDLERFVPDDDGRGEYAVVQLLLAVLAGSPAQARALFGALSE
ncbi:MAG: P-loop NTPase fold protein, partial [Actinomycetota bacterium]